MRVSVAWALLADVVPLYPLYSLLFADSGLSDARISALFAIWSLVGIVGEVPLGALADRFSRRAALVAAGGFQAAGYALWTAWPTFPGFAAGFVLWGLGGALSSGALEALLYDGLAAVSAQHRFAPLLGRVRAAGLLAQLPAAGAATVLFSLGGYGLVGWVSVGCCLGAGALAMLLPEAPRATADEDADQAGYFATLRAGVAEAAARPAVRTAVLAVAVLGSLDAFEEYIPLAAQHWGVPTAVIPLADLAIPLAGAIGAALVGAASRCSPAVLGLALGAAFLVLGAAGVVRAPAGLAAVAVFYGVYRLVLVVADARLQQRIEGPHRATVTSVAGLGEDLACLLVYSAWALGEVVGVAALGLAVALALPYWLRGRRG